jgi:peptide/nickel transport system substrate-binding protein
LCICYYRDFDQMGLAAQGGKMPVSRRRFKFILPFAAAMAAMLGCSGCRRSHATSALSTSLQIDIETSPTSLDPRLATDAWSQRLDELAYDSLVKPARNLDMTGDLACSIERRSPVTLVFHLCPNVRFADGRRLTARDVVYTYDSVLAPSTLSPKRGALSELASITAPDPATVVITTRRPYAPALELGTFGVVPFGSRPPGARGSIPPPGSGPFAIAAFHRDEGIVMVRNPFRPWPPGAARKLVFKVVPDPTVRTLELAEGSCGFAENNIKPDLLDYLGTLPRLTINRAPGTTYQYLIFNFRDSRLRDLRVRRAIAYAIDRRSIATFMLRGTARLATGLLAPENWAYSGDVPTYAYDPVRARALLDEAGYPAGADGSRGLKFVYKTTPEGVPLAEAIQAMLRRVGIGLSIRINEWATYYGDIQRGNFDIASMQWVGVNDPHQYFEIFNSRMLPPRGANRGAYSNPEMDRLVELGDVTLDPAQRRRIYAAVQRLAAADLPYVSLFWIDNIAVMRRSFSGFVAYPNGSLRSLAQMIVAPASAAVPTQVFR